MKLSVCLSFLLVGIAPARATASDLVERGAGSETFRDGTPVYYSGGAQETWAARVTEDSRCQFACDSDDPDVATPTPPEAGVDRVPVQVADWCAGYARSTWVAGQGGRTYLLDLSHRGPEGNLLPASQGALSDSERIPVWPEQLPLRPAKGYYERSDVGGYRSGNLDDWLRAQSRLADPVRSLRELQSIAVAGCDRARYAPRQRRVANWLQQWLNIHRLPLADAKHLMSELVLNPFPKQALADAIDGHDPEHEREQLFPTASPTARALLWGTVSKVASPLTALDGLARRQGATELERLSVLASIRANPDASEAAKLVLADELASIDWAKFEGCFERKSAAQRFVLDRLLPDFRAWLEAATARVDTASVRSAHETWDALVAAHPGLVEHALALIDSESSAHDEAKKRCAETLIGWWEKLVVARHPASKAELAALTDEPAVDFLYRTQAQQCPAAQLTFRNARFEDPIVGPRTLLGYRLSTKGKAAGQGETPFANELFGDPQKADACPPSDHTQACADYFGRKIARVKTAPEGGLLVEWAPATWSEPVEKCTPTARVDRIDERGQVFYQEDCRVVGSATKTSAYTPSLFPSTTAALLKPGRYVRLFKPVQGAAMNPEWSLAAVFPDLANARKSTHHLAIFGHAI